MDSTILWTLLSVWALLICIGSTYVLALFAVGFLAGWRRARKEARDARHM